MLNAYESKRLLFYILIKSSVVDDKTNNFVLSYNRERRNFTHSLAHLNNVKS